MHFVWVSTQQLPVSHMLSGSLYKKMLTNCQLQYSCINLIQFKHKMLWYIILNVCIQNSTIIQQLSPQGLLNFKKNANLNSNSNISHLNVWPFWLKVTILPMIQYMLFLCSVRPLKSPSWCICYNIRLIQGTDLIAIMNTMLFHLTFS